MFPNKPNQWQTEEHFWQNESLNRVLEMEIQILAKESIHFFGFLCNIFLQN